MILALGVVFIPSFARMTRSEFISQREMDYVKSARLMGVSHLRIIFVHILPNTLPTVLATAAIGFNNAVLAEAGMSYLGIGVQPPRNCEYHEYQCIFRNGPETGALKHFNIIIQSYKCPFPEGS